MSDPRAALEAIGALPDSELDLADAALQLARVDCPDADWLAVRDHLSGLARESVSLAIDIDPHDLPAQAGALAGLLAGRHGYAGDTESYDDVANANLIRVVERRRGLPVTLGILWLHCARAAGWQAYGINFPGHFLIGLSAGGGQIVLNVFAGGEPMDARDLRALVKRVEGPKAELHPDLIEPMADRAVLLRLQYNISQRRTTAGDIAGALSCTEDMLRIAPDIASIWRDAAILNQHLDQVGAALRCFGKCLDLVPEGEAADRVRSAMTELRTRLN